MPRSGWLAVGAVAAALVGELLGLRVVAASVAAAAAMLVMLGSTAATATRRRIVPATVAVLCAATAIAARMALLPADASTVPILPDGDGPWHAIVVATGSPREGRQSATIELVEPGAAPIRLAATLPRYPTVAPGQRVVLDGGLEPRPESPYGAYLERTGVAGTILSRSLEVEAGPSEASGALEWIRRAAAGALARALPEPEAGLAAGILIGLRERVDRELAADFTTAGVSHVVAISGWNIAIVAAAVGALGGSLGRRRRSVLTMLAIVAYVCFSGASPSVVRAAAMAGVVLLARESGRAGRAAAALGWAVALLLLADPALIADAGFQLSSLATAGLIAWATPLAERITRIGGGRVPGWLAESLGVSLAAQAATLPVVLATFGRLALVAPVANLAIVPVVPVAMAAGGVAFVAGVLAELGAPAVLTAVLAFPGWLALTMMVAVARFAADAPFASATLDPPTNLMAAGASVVSLAGLEWRRRHPRRRRGAAPAAVPAARDRTRPPRGVARSTRVAVLALASSIVLTAAVVVERPAGRPTVTVLDVGQGDAILVEGSNGGRLLVDGGPDPDRLLVELDRRIPPWDRRLDAVVLSHPHEDHVAGLALLLERYRVGRTFEPGMLGPGPGYAAWAAELAGRPTPGSLLAAGDRLAVDDIALEVLWPVRGSVPRTPPDTGTGINNVSIVLLGSVAGRRFLLTGDVEEEVDPDLLGRVGKVDLLKIAHHGSRTASTDAFLDTADPTVAVASAGAGNPYGHPAPATLARVEARGARVFRTDRDGSVAITFDPTGISIRSSGGRPRPTPRPKPSASVTGVATTAWFCAVPQRTAAQRGVGPESVDVARASAIRIADPSLYHRLDDGARQDRSRPAVALARTAGLAPSSLPRRRRGCRIPRRSDGTAGRTGRPRARRNGRTHARHRQGAAGDRSPPAAAPRPRFGALARGARPRRVGPGSRAPPGDAAAGRRLVRCLAARLASRRPHRRVRRQACRPAVGADGRPLRRLAAPLPGRLGR
jgi:competence protein ComEC